MTARRSAIESWPPEQVDAARRWVQAWREAAPRLEAIRRQELRALDTFTTIAQLCGPADYHEPPRT